MWKWIVGGLILAGVGFAIYDYRSSPYFDAPEVEEGDFLLAIKKEGGLRGVMRGIDDERQTRRYFAYGASGVPSWYRESWSNCRKPSEDERAAFLNQAEIGPGGRLDALCEINADGDVFIRGWVASVPDL